MSEELLNIVKELSEKPTTELALQFMELTADNIIKDKEINRLNNIINEAIGFTNSHFKEMVADEEAQALLSILKKGENNE